MCCVLGYAGHDLSKEKFTELLMRTASWVMQDTTWVIHL